MRVVAGQPATLRLQVATDGGSPVAADASPAVTVTAGDGLTVLYQAQTSTAATGTGAYQWVLPAQTKLDLLTATWSYTVGGASYSVPVPVNVVAARLASPYLCRQDPNVSAANLSDGALLDLIDQVEDKIEEFLGYPPVLSGARQEWDTLRGTLTDALYISGTVNGLPYGWGAGRMLVPGVKLPAVGEAPSGTADLYTAVPAGPVASVDLAGDQTSKIGSGYQLALISGASPFTVTTTNAGSYDGTKTTYTVAAATSPELIAAGASVPWVGPAAGPGAVYAGSINGVALDPVADIPKLRVIGGALAWSDYRPWISGRYQMWLTHGDPNPPGDLRAAARKLVSFYAKTSNYPERAAQVITEGATIVMTFADKDHPTGIPDVDAVLRRCRLEAVI